MISNANNILIFINIFVQQINKGFLDKVIFNKIIHSNLKMNFKKIISLILLDSKLGNWNIARQDAQYLIHDIQNQILNGYRIVGNKP